MPAATSTGPQRMETRLQALFGSPILDQPPCAESSPSKSRLLTMPSRGQMFGSGSSSQACGGREERWRTVRMSQDGRLGQRQRMHRCRSPQQVRCAIAGSLGVVQMLAQFQHRVAVGACLLLIEAATQVADQTLKLWVSHLHVANRLSLWPMMQRLLQSLKRIPVLENQITIHTDRLRVGLFQTSK